MKMKKTITMEADKVEFYISDWGLCGHLSLIEKRGEDTEELNIELNMSLVRHLSECLSDQLADYDTKQEEKQNEKETV